MNFSEKMADKIKGLKRKQLLFFMGIGLLVFYLATAYTAQNNNSLTLHKPTEIEELNLTKTFLNARLNLSKTDSIGLVIDLSDSTLFLELKGVPIYVVKITKYKSDKYFRGITDTSYHNIFSLPFDITDQKATLEKEPFIIRNAPKDTAEAAQFVHNPDTVIDNPVRITFTLQNNLKLILKEENNYIATRQYRSLSSMWARFLLKNINSFFFMKVHEHLPAIELEIPKKEAISVFRALPYHSQVVIRI